MPNFFQLMRKSAPEAGPVPLVTIDEEMCAHFGVKPDERRYHAEWYDVVGFELAMGNSFAKQREERVAKMAKQKEVGNDYGVAHQQKIIAVIDWLATHFTSDSWARVGK